MLNALTEFVVLSLLKGKPFKTNQNFALLLNFHFNHDALTSVEVFKKAINSCINETYVFVFYPTKLVTAKR